MSGPSGDGGHGGAIYNAAGATLSATNDTFAANSAQSQRVYGTDGFNIIDDQQTYPSYATVSYSGYSDYVWAGSTVDPRALQNPSRPRPTASPRPSIPRLPSRSTST